jgi:hypothetical protein
MPLWILLTNILYCQLFRCHLFLIFKSLSDKDQQTKKHIYKTWQEWRIHILSKTVLCYSTYLIALNDYLLQIQIHYFKTALQTSHHTVPELIFLYISLKFTD